MKNRIQIVVALVLMSVALGACSVNPATGKQSFTGFMSPEKELQVGAEEHPKMIKQFGGVWSDRALSVYVRELGLELAKTSEKPDLPWEFTVLNDTNVNAFALPGGYIYVTRGLLALASDKAELAGVLSHEIGHVTARHTAQRYSSTVAANVGIQVLGVLSQVAGLGRIGGDLASIGANAALKSYSRDQELESDMLGVRYMTNVGYDPNALISFFEKLRAHQKIEAIKAGKDKDIPDQTNIFATHPRTLDRIEQAVQLAETNDHVSVRRGANEYLNQIDGLVFGDDAKEGLIRGQMFIHPDLKFRFEVPEGFKLENKPDMVVAKNSDGAIIKFAMANAKEVRKAGGMEQYFEVKWGSGYDFSNKEWIDINGMTAITGETTVWTGRSNTVLRRVLIERDKNTYWQLQFEIPPDHKTELNEPLRRTTYSLREPNFDELSEAKSWRVRVVSVGPRVTYDDLVNAMAMDDMKAEWFEVLNNIKSEDPLPRGQRIKVIK